jgi:calcineurin-like phosphoesterase family protein
LEHQPSGVSGWHIHGHVHNNDLNNYPCIHPGRKTVNASAELLGYRPLSFDRLTRLLDKKQRYTELPEHEREAPR